MVRLTSSIEYSDEGEFDVKIAYREKLDKSGNTVCKRSYQGNASRNYLKKKSYEVKMQRLTAYTMIDLMIVLVLFSHSLDIE